MGLDLRRRVAATTGVATLRLEHRPVRGVVTLDERGLSLERRRDRAELDLHDAAVDLALDLLQLGARQARCDPLDVRDHGPRFVDRSVDRELVDELFCHRWRSSTVSMSIGEPSHGTASTRSGRRRINERAPSSPSAGSRSQTSRRRRTGWPCRPSYVATAIAASVAATARQASGVTNGWSPRPTTTAAAPSSAAAARPRRSDVIWPSAHRSLTTWTTAGVQRRRQLTRRHHDNGPDAGRQGRADRPLDDRAAADGGVELVRGTSEAGARPRGEDDGDDGRDAAFARDAGHAVRRHGRESRRDRRGRRADTLGEGGDGARRSQAVMR